MYYDGTGKEGENRENTSKEWRIVAKTWKNNSFQGKGTRGIPPKWRISTFPHNESKNKSINE